VRAGVLLLGLVGAGCADRAVKEPRASEMALSAAVSSPTAAQKVRARLPWCSRQISQGLFKTDDEPSAPANIPICEHGDLVYWRADFDVDCDGVVTKACNARTDPAFQSQTAAVTSQGKFLDAESLPYVVVPQASPAFDFTRAGLELGSVVMVVYRERVAFAIIGDTGPANIIGEGSYALARALGINPDPRVGGTSEPVLYVAFKGKAAVVTKNESHAEAVELGRARAAAVLDAR
jgi:hypothetical protein